MRAYVMVAPGEPLRVETRPMPRPGPGEVVVEVIACGLCHTDYGYLRGGVPTRHPPPLVLGHEVVGRVVSVGPSAVLDEGTPVLVPAVLPCGECAFCRAGRGNICPRQKMPGNDIDGGFATHMVVPAKPLVPLDEARWGDRLPELSVVADAVSTAWQAVRRARVTDEDLVVVVGVGGVGSFVVQCAAALGACVVALDVRDAPLERIRRFGAHEVRNVAGDDARAHRKWLRAYAASRGIASLHWKIFEASGTAAGQQLAYGLLDRAATLVVVGYTPKKLELRLSNLMAFDATVVGTWGCPHEAYPEVLDLIADGKVQLSPFVQMAPMSRLDAWMDAMGRHELTHRLVLDPRA